MKALMLVLIALALSPLSGAGNILVNADFAKGMESWEPYGNDKAMIRVEKGAGQEGGTCIAVPVAHASIAQNMDLKPRTSYELSIVYRRSAPSTGCGLVFFFNKPGGINASAGVINMEYPEKEGTPGKWEEFREIISTPGGTRLGKVVLSARGTGEVLFARVTLTEAPGKLADKIKSSDWSVLSRTRTKNPIYKELLTDEPGGYRMVAWGHNLNRKNLPPSLLDRYPEDKWPEEVERMYKESGAVGLGYYNLPWQGDKADDLYERFGVTFDVMCESSGVNADAVKAGGELLNPIASSKTSAKPTVSLIDPIYVNTAVDTLKTFGERFKGKPYVFVYIGDDEPSIPMPEGPIATWGPFWKKAADEVLKDYGFGKYAMPARDDPGYQNDEKNRPFRWIAYNTWMADKYVASKKVMYNALKSVDPSARYNPCDYWFMTGFTPYDFGGMAEYSDLVECDPYASSAERIPGRGLYNHGFGPKLLSDLTGKPVRSIVQAFDYAGYEMTPEDLREWVSQSMRAGADHISYYQMDNPRFNDPERWAMMLHLSKTITAMSAIKRPHDADVAIYYSAASHRAEGASTKANEIYTAYSILGERVGSWFDFIADESLVMGEKHLDRYKAVYIPLGTYLWTEEEAGYFEARVRRGGTLICGDPTALSWTAAGKDISSYRERIFGVKTIKPVNRTSMTITDTCGIAGLKVGETLPIYRPVGREGWTDDNGWLIETTGPTVKVIAKFDDGSPAITMAKYGEGRAIYFAANPFVPECLLGGDRWDGFFRALQQHLGAKIDRPIWHFKFPAP